MLIGKITSHRFYISLWKNIFTTRVWDIINLKTFFISGGVTVKLKQWACNVRSDWERRLIMYLLVQFSVSGIRLKQFWLTTETEEEQVQKCRYVTGIKWCGISYKYIINVEFLFIILFKYILHYTLNWKVVRLKLEDSKRIVGTLIPSSAMSSLLTALMDGSEGSETIETIHWWASAKMKYTRK